MFPTGNSIPTGKKFFPLPYSGPLATNKDKHVRRAGYDGVFPNQDRKLILKKFYQHLESVFENEEEYQNKVNEFFSVENQIQRDPNEYLEINELYMYFLTLFYTNHSLIDKINQTGIIWVRNGSQMFQIILKEDSGSIYQNPYSPTDGIIFLGICQDADKNKNMFCFCSGNDKNIMMIDNYYYLRSHIVHHIEDSILHPKIEIIEIKDKDVEPNFSKAIQYILSGELADTQIECSDGVINVSKAYLAQYSEYFLILFTQNNYAKQDSFKINFPKKVMEKYLYYCLNVPCDLDVNLLNEIIDFGDFIQDFRFLQYIYMDIYKNREHFSNKTLLDIIKFYSKMDI